MEVQIFESHTTTYSNVQVDTSLERNTKKV